MTIIPRRNWEQRLWKIWGGGEQGALWSMWKWWVVGNFARGIRDIAQVSTIWKKKLLQKAVGFEPTTQMVQYCRFSHDVTIIQNKKQFFSSNETRKGSFHTNERKNKWAAIVKEVYNGNWRTFNRKWKHFSKWILAEIPVMLNQIRAKSVRHEAKTLWQPWTWLFRLKISLKTAWQEIGRKKPLQSRHLA